MLCNTSAVNLILVGFTAPHGRRSHTSHKSSSPALLWVRPETLIRIRLV